MDELTKLGIKYNTDKATFHKYTKFYNKHLQSLRNHKISLLEIGVYEGNSLLMWKDYFPNAETIMGLDHGHPPHLLDDKIIIKRGEQSNLKFLSSNFKNNKFDIIIDDGGHTMKQQQISFSYFFYKLKSKGYYIIEDLHTSFYERRNEEFVNNYKDVNCNITTFDLINSLKEKKCPDSNYIDKEKLKFILNGIDSIDIFFKNPPEQLPIDSITCIIKKK